MFSYSAFAGTDTERICHSEQENGWMENGISVAYPGKKVVVEDVWRVSFSTENNIPYSKLYYVVNIYNQDGTTIERWELYEYNCVTKTPKMLRTFIQNKSNQYNEEYRFSIETITNEHILIKQWVVSSYDGTVEIESAFIFSIAKNRVIVSVLDTGWLSFQCGIKSLIPWKDATWYFYVEDVNCWLLVPPTYIRQAWIYKIDPKTRKITKL